MDNDRLRKIIIGLVLVIILFAIILLLRGCEDTAKIVLTGGEKITINQNERYIEPGYTITETSSPENFYVNVDGFVNINKIGAYYLTYNLYNSNGKIVSFATRQVIVLKDKLSNVSMYLKGEDEEYFFVNDYIDHGIEVYDGSNDISNDVVIETDLKEDQVGSYEVRYQIHNNSDLKEAIRKVNIIDYEIDEEIDLKNLFIDLYIKCEDYDYTILPDKTKSYSKNVTYQFNDIGEYEFDIYLKSESHKKYIVNIETIDKDGPVGTCKLYHENNKTTITMDVTDASGISKFSYNGLDFYGNTTTINSVATNISVRAYDIHNNYTDIKCKAELSLGFKNLNLSDSGQLLNKTGYIVCGTSVTKANQELEMLMQSYGYKTRSAVAGSVLFLLNYPYHVHYFWGGKTSSKGLDPTWGCWKSHTADHNCSERSKTNSSQCKYGLDCGGLIKWAYIQAGFDQSIIRGEDIVKFKWGEFNPAKHKYNFSNENMAYANQLKPGDLVHRTGHIGIVIGVDNEYVQVAEMLGPEFVNKIEKRTGRSLSKQKGFTEFVLMDEFFSMYGAK